MKKRVYEILMYINGVIYIMSFFGFFFLSSELTELAVKMLGIVFMVSNIIALILVCILVRKEKKEKDEE